MELNEVKIEASDGCNDFDELKSSTIKVSSDTKTSKSTELCNCPLRCYEKVTPQARDYLFSRFSSLQRHNLQNKYLQKYIVIRSVAKRLWEDEIIDGKMQRRVTCKYQVPNLKDEFLGKEGSVKENVIIGMSSSCEQNDVSSGSGVTVSKAPIVNGHHDDNDEDSASDMSTDTSSSDSESDELMCLTRNTNNVKPAPVLTNVEICQKAFINIYHITEKRIRYLRERLIVKSRFLAERKQKKIEETQRILSIAHDLGAGCQPLIAVLEKTNSLHLSNQIFAAIENDVFLLNNFFRHQLWKPEDISCVNLNLENKNDVMTQPLLQRLDTMPKLM